MMVMVVSLCFRFAKTASFFPPLLGLPLIFAVAPAEFKIRTGAEKVLPRLVALASSAILSLTRELFLVNVLV
jgi:hypothetical protein